VRWREKDREDRQITSNQLYSRLIGVKDDDCHSARCRVAPDTALVDSLKQTFSAVAIRSFNFESEDLALWSSITSMVWREIERPRSRGQTDRDGQGSHPFLVSLDKMTKRERERERERERGRTEKPN
jgi:hypothetical protein